MVAECIESEGTRVWTTSNEAETEAVGAILATLLPSDTTILLAGDLGAGKTVLVRGLCTALGVDRREVQSPSFALIHEHQGAKGSLVHVDLYRLEPQDIPSLGLDELLSGPGFKAIEWADRLGEIPPRAVWVHIEASTEQSLRRIVLNLGPFHGSDPAS